MLHPLWHLLPAITITATLLTCNQIVVADLRAGQLTPRDLGWWPLLLPPLLAATAISWWPVIVWTMEKIGQ